MVEDIDTFEGNREEDRAGHWLITEETSSLAHIIQKSIS